MSSLRFSDVIPHLLESIPEIRPYYDTRVRELYARSLAHVVYGSIFVEHIHALEAQLPGANPGATNAALARAFALLEELVASDDFETRCIAETSVLESMVGEKGGLRRFKRFMGQGTYEMARKVVAQMGIEE